MFETVNKLEISQDQPPVLLVVIDTEEEFDWSKPADRNANTVRAMEYVGRAQEIFDEYGIRPCYVIDFPVASQPEGYLPLKNIHASGRCEIGAHLHPWVNPPFCEELSSANTYPGNLSPEIERAKLEALTRVIKDNLGLHPHIYKAGRYGVGENSASILKDLGYTIDLSFCPPVDYRADGGPDFRNCDSFPQMLGNSDILELPTTGALVGWLGPLMSASYSMAARFNRLRAVAVLSKLRAADRLMLSPEGFSTEEHIRLTNFLYARGLRVFTWSFHSPSVLPGCTPYVNNDRELLAFMDSFRRYFDFFFEKLGGKPTSPTDLQRQLRGQ